MEEAEARSSPGRAMRAGGGPELCPGSLNRECLWAGVREEWRGGPALPNPRQLEPWKAKSGARREGARTEGGGGFGEAVAALCLPRAGRG